MHDGAMQTRMIKKKTSSNTSCTLHMLFLQIALLYVTLYYFVKSSRIVRRCVALVIRLDEYLDCWLYMVANDDRPPYVQRWYRTWNNSKSLAGSTRF